jgi:hypothetical protein
MHCFRTSWLVDFCVPNNVLAAVPNNLRSFNCSYSWLCNGSAGISLLNPHHPLLQKLSSLTSLAVFDMVPSERQDVLSSLLTLNRSSLKHLKLRFRRPTSPADTYVSDDPLSPLLHALGELGEPLRLHALEMYLLGRPDTSRLRQVFDFGSVQKLAVIHEIAILEETLVSQLLGPSSSLKSLHANFDTMPLVDFVEQSAGLEELLIHQQSRSFIERLPSLSGHFKTLRTLFLPALPSIYYSRQPDLDYLQMVITNCISLEQLAVTVSSSSQVSTRFYALANSGPC